MRNVLGILILFCSATAITAQQTANPNSDAPKPEAITRLSATTYRIGEITVDTAAGTLAVPGTVNDAATLEFVATTIKGLKGYESAMTLNTNAVTFNAAMLLLGVDPTRGKPSKFQFDPDAPEGDPVEITVAWTIGGKTRTEPVESLIFDQVSKKTLPAGPWVYTGSQFVETPDYRLYLAELDGVLIGFMHGPQSIIDNPRNDAIGRFGTYILNPELGLKPESPVILTVKVIGKRE
jgi:hypothetical protein